MNTEPKPKHTAKHATILALNTAEQMVWQAHDTAENLRHVRKTSQNLDAIYAFSAELVENLQRALDAARTLEKIAASDLEHRREMDRQRAALLQEIA